MNSTMARLLIRLYPRAWRDRYGSEFEALLANNPGGVRELANVIWSALRERTIPTKGLQMNQNYGSFGVMVRHPSAFLPLMMSLSALAVVLGNVALHGVAREADEGAAAHVWQLLMAGQMPVLVFFAVKWLPRAPKQTLLMMALQAGSALASMAPVFYFNL